MGAGSHRCFPDPWSTSATSACERICIGEVRDRRRRQTFSPTGARRDKGLPAALAIVGPRPVVLPIGQIGQDGDI
jgi:hypothetical protein